MQATHSERHTISAISSLVLRFFSLFSSSIITSKKLT
nr:MAG TPA: hypothetical protein [Caudoviricetes sp.]